MLVSLVLLRVLRLGVLLPRVLPAGLISRHSNSLRSRWMTNGTLSGAFRFLCPPPAFVKQDAPTEQNTVGNGGFVPYLFRVRLDPTYRRRRLGTLLVGATALCVLYAGTGAEAERSPTPYTVSRGDTLWSIAAGHYPRSEDPRVRVSEIQELNHLEGYELQPGEHLKLPSR